MAAAGCSERSNSYSVGCFPRLSGRYGVGIVDVLPSLRGEEPLLMRLYYPTQRDAGDVPQSILAKGMAKEYRRAYFKSIISGLKAVDIGTIPSIDKSKTNDYNVPGILHETPLKPELLRKFPVVVFSHGLTAMRSVYSLLHCDLASHGYIVAAVEHKDGSACLSYTKTKSENTQGGEPVYEDKWIEFTSSNLTALPLRYNQVKQRSSEMSAALDFLTFLEEGKAFTDLLSSGTDFTCFQNRIDLEHPVAMGHSFGGGTTVVTLATDKRFRCGVALDTWMFPVYNEVYDLVKTPLVFINSWDFQWARNVECMMKFVKKPEKTRFSTCQLFTIRDSNHVSHCDMPFLYPSSHMKWLGSYSPDGDIYEVFDASLQLMYAFLNRHLWNDPSPQPILDGGEGQHRLVMSGTNIGDLSVVNRSKADQQTEGRLPAKL